MGQPKLLLIEGIMGSGKTTTAQVVEQFLQERNRATEVFLEGNLDHPADFDAVACFDEQTLQALLGEHHAHQDLLREMVVQEGADYLIYYGKEFRSRGEELPRELYQDLAKGDIYDGVSLAKHRELMQRRWGQFAKQQAQREVTTIFECCFLQNPMCAFLARHNAGAETVQDHVLKLANLIQPLDPILIYYYQNDVRETIERVSAHRSKEWLEFVIRYHTEQAYGVSHHLQGLEGLVEFLRRRQELELEICQQLPIRTLIVDNSDYDFARGQNEVRAFLAEIF